MRSYKSKLLGLGCVAAVALLGARQAAAQDVSDQVKKAIAAAVQNSVADTIDKTVVQAAAPGGVGGAVPAAGLMNTFWGRPQFSEFISVTSVGAPHTTHTPAEILPVGAIIGLTPDLFAGLSATYAHVGGTLSANLYGGDGTLTYVFYRSGPVNFRANGDFEVFQFSPGKGSGSTSYNLTPTIDFETVIDRFVLTLSPGFGLGWTSVGAPGEPSETWQTTAKITYLAGAWQPQFAIQYTQSLHPTPTSGQMSFTPELNYVVGQFTAGVGYQYSTNLGGGGAFYSHSVLANLRYRF